MSTEITQQYMETRCITCHATKKFLSGDMFMQVGQLLEMFCHMNKCQGDVVITKQTNALERIPTMDGCKWWIAYD